MAIRDLDVILKWVGLDKWMFVWVISMNLPFGPNDDFQRHHDLRAEMRKVYALHPQAQHCALFMARCDTIAEELEEAGLWTLAESQGSPAERGVRIVEGGRAIRQIRPQSELQSIPWIAGAS